MGINSENISVFPSVRRVFTRPTSRMMSEQNLVGLVNKLIDAEGFVIPTYKSTNGVYDRDANGNKILIETISGDYPLEFNIYGYYFKIKDPYTELQLASRNGNVYASIEIVEFTGDDEVIYEELFGQDELESDEYTGLIITDNLASITPTHGGYMRTLKIATFKDGQWIVPEESRIKFNQSSLTIDVIDGGLIS